MESGSRRLFTAALVGAMTFALAGCGSDSDGTTKTESEHTMSATPAAQVTTAPSADARVIGVTIGADSVSPDGTRIEVERNQPVVLEIDAVAEGELHVHSTPEMAIEFPAGKSQVQFELDKAGVVDVEDHGLDMLIVQLEVK
jgi:hypothetical protein